MARARKLSPLHLLRFAVALASLSVCACSLLEAKPAVLWTDTPEMLIAVEMFNASQSRHLIEVHYVEALAETLSAPPMKTQTQPSLIIGKGLRTAALNSYFESMEYLFGELVIPKSGFYPGLLEGGVENSRQTLVPVSFNLVLVISGKGATGQGDSSELHVPAEESTAITMEEIQRRAILFNSSSKGLADRIGFSPRWPDRDFLFQWMQLSGADFAENRSKNEKKNANGEILPLTWNPSGLESAVSSLRDYVRVVNGSVAAEDAFAFKYLFAPGYKNVETGKILFAAMNSADYFTLSPMTRSKYDYRYFSEKGKLALSEEIKYAGIPRKAPNKESAEQFLHWFFNAEHQKAILEKSRALRLSESAFGIAGGFSSFQSVTESLFPSYYTDLMGHIPPKALVAPPKAMPPAWDRIKTDVIMPWLEKTAGEEAGANAGDELTANLETYLDKNPDLRSGEPR
ncbi:MAG: hypothetical protein WC820_00585 [Spirochaetales bacterium]|jgi:hypothetical protein